MKQYECPECLIHSITPYCSNSHCLEIRRLDQ